MAQYALHQASGIASLEPTAHSRLAILDSISDRGKSART